MQSGNHYLIKLANIGLLPSAAKRYLNLVTQDYRGDVTILPVPSVWAVVKTISNPSPDEIDNYKLESARRTFPKICMIENIFKIELALDNNYSKLTNILNRNKYITKQKNYLDEKNNNFEIGAKQEMINKLGSQQETIRDEESISENENLDEISEKHCSLVFYNGYNTEITKPNINNLTYVINELRSKSEADSNFSYDILKDSLL